MMFSALMRIAPALLLFEWGAFSSAWANEAWQRPWVVKSIYCPVCGSKNLRNYDDLIGRTIILSPVSFDNPIYESCRDGVDYSAMRLKSRASALKDMEPGRLPRNALADRVVEGAVHCREANGVSNVVGKFLFDGSKGFYLYEEGLVLVLQ
jgi:hypothetical protein